MPPRLADSLRTALQQREQVAAEVEEILDAHPLAGVLTSMPGIGIRTAARILLEIGDATGFTSSGHLAAYAGIAPVTRSSGSSIKGEHPARTEGKKHNAALICLARRRCDILFAMLRTKTFCRTPEITAAA